MLFSPREMPPEFLSSPTASKVVLLRILLDTLMLLTVSLILAFSGRLTMKLTVDPLPLLMLKSSCRLPAVYLIDQ